MASVNTHSKKPHLVVLTTHPIQYQAPLFRALGKQNDMRLTVLYASLQGARAAVDPDFGVEYKWDVPLLDGYDWRCLENAAGKPSVSTFRGTKIPGLQDLLAQLQPDAVLLPGWGRRYYAQGLLAAFRLGIPVLVRGEARLMPNQPLHKKLLKKLVIAPVMRRAAAVVVIGRRNREFYEWCGIPSQRFFETLYFVDNDFFSKAARENAGRRAELRRQWGIPEDAVTFLFAGKMTEKKRPCDLLRALHRASSNGVHPNGGMHCLMVGDGQLREECRSYAERNRLSVSFTGFLNQSELVDAYAASDCLVLPSDYRETWGLVVNEAMASGLTAIISDQVGCGPDLISNGSTGFVFPFADVAALGKRMTELADNPLLLAKLKKNAARHVAKYDLGQAVKGVRDALEYACGNGQNKNSEPK